MTMHEIKRTISYGLPDSLIPVPNDWIEKSTEIDYRGFTVGRIGEYLHWTVISGPGNTETPHKLIGQYTSLETLKGHIDRHLENESKQVKLAWERQQNEQK